LYSYLYSRDIVSQFDEDVRKKRRKAILILATDEHGETRINTEEFNKLTIK
jgi:hypothetical protein